MTHHATALPDVSPLTVGILGGTGDQGRGLAYRLARAGQRVRIGSRSADRGRQAAAELAGLPGVATAGTPAGPGADPAAAVRGLLTGGDNGYAAGADLVIVAVPWEGHRDTLADLSGALAGKVVIDCVNPLGFDNQGAYPLDVPEGSAAQQAAALLPASAVCAAFHHVSAVLLADPEVTRFDLDVMVLGDDREAVALAQALTGRIPGMRGVYAGRLRNARQVEALTANLISINRRYKTHAGIRVTGLS